MLKNCPYCAERFSQRVEWAAAERTKTSDWNWQDFLSPRMNPTPQNHLDQCPTNRGSTGFVIALLCTNDWEEGRTRLPSRAQKLCHTRRRVSAGLHRLGPTSISSPALKGGSFPEPGGRPLLLPALAASCLRPPSLNRLPAKRCRPPSPPTREPPQSPARPPPGLTPRGAGCHTRRSQSRRTTILFVRVLSRDGH